MEPSDGAPPGCLDDDAVQALIAGELADAELAAAKSHMDACAECREIVAASLKELVVDRRLVTTGIMHLQPAEEAATVDGDEGATPSFLDRYEMRDSLGEGGMGEVLLCRDTRIGRDVALKVIRDKMRTNREVRGRFLREVRVQGQLEHPSIVPVYDLGEEVLGSTYFTMKRVRGLTLADILDRLRRKEPTFLKTYSLRKLLSAFGSVCLAVDFAHSRSVIHRDLKPSNVMLGDFGEVYLLDWGIAKIIGELDDAPVATPAVADDMKTTTGSFVGTLGYVSPEQLTGSHVDARSEVYALGAVLFELLTHQRLHEGNAARKIHSTIHGVDARCSVRAPTSEVSPELEALCVRATKTEPEERFASVRELHDALERYLDGDRDAQRRRVLAEEHTKTALLAIEEVAEENPASAASRALALRELGRALALDPSNEVATRAIVGLLVRPPQKPPREVHEQMDRANLASLQLSASAGAAAFVGAFLCLGGFVLAMGVRSWLCVALVAGSLALSAAFCAVQARGATHVRSYFILFAAAFAIMALSRFFGPLLWLPSAAMGLAIAYAMNPAKKIQRLALVVMVVSILLPLALEWVDVLPRSYAFRDGAMLLTSQLCVLRETGTMALLVLTTTSFLFVTWWAIQRVRNALTLAEEKLSVQAWQLRHLVPDTALASVAVPGHRT